MPCYTETPKESQILYDRIFVLFLNNDIASRQQGFAFIKELIDAYVKMHAERNRMGNILCDLGKQIKNNVSYNILPITADFLKWLEEHEKRDNEKNKSLPSPNSLFSFDPKWIQMGE